jgi:class 3 adenylate cyclase/tetratricopeptide (TPR) repeat protein
VGWEEILDVPGREHVDPLLRPDVDAGSKHEKAFARRRRSAAAQIHPAGKRAYLDRSSPTLSTGWCADTLGQRALGGFYAAGVTSPRPETVTVLFTDVVGSTAFRTQVGDARADVRLLELERMSRDVVAGHGGEVVKGLGDGVMATFSSGVAALDAAVALQIVVERFYRAAGLQLRFGLSTGDLVREGIDWHGVAAIEASRLCADAAGGTVLVSASTVLLARGRLAYELRRVGNRRLRGFDTPIEVFELTPPKHDDLPAALARVVPAKLVGRSREVAAGEGLLEALAAGESRSLLIVGEAGVGKSSLAGAIGRVAAARDFVVVYGHCDEGLRVSYQPVIEAFGSWLATCPDVALARVVGKGAPELVRLWPDLARRLPGLPPPSEAEPETQRWRLFDAVVSLAAAIAEERALLVVVDDFHWADPATALMLRHLCDAAVPRVGVLATSRDRDADDDTRLVFDQFGTARDVRLLSLAGLESGEIGEFIALHAGELPPDALSRWLKEETDGNPFFLGALIGHLVESGMLRTPGGQWLTPAQLNDLELPSGVRVMIERRLGRLSPRQRQALDAAAIVGQSFSVTTVASVLGIGLDDTIDALDEAVKVGLLREHGPGHLGFAHALVRHAAVANLSLTRQARLHWRVAEELERTTGDTASHLDAIAYHYAAGRDVGNPAAIVRSALAAGDDAMRRLAFEDAVHQFRTALEALEGMPSDDNLRYRVLVSLAEALNCMTGADVAQPLWLDAAEVARRRRDGDGLFRAMMGYSYMLRLVPDREADRLFDELIELLPPGDSSVRAQALAWKAGRTWERDPQLAAEAVGMARRTGDPMALMGTLGSTVWLESAGPNTEAMLAAAESLSQLVETDDAQPVHMVWTATRSLVWARMRLGQRDEAEQALAKCRRLALETRQGLAMHNTMIWDAALAIAEGRFSDGKRIAADAQEHGGAHNSVVALAYGAQILAARMEQGATERVVASLRQLGVLLDHMPAWRAMLVGALAETGDDSQVVGQLRDLLSGDSHLPTDHTAPLGVRYLCEICRQVRDVEAAKTLLPDVAPWTGQLLVVTLGTSIEGAADRSIGHLLATLGRFEEADAAYRSAAQLELRNAFTPLAARTHYWHARMLLERRSRGDRELAEELLKDVISVARKLGMDLLARQAAAPLEPLKS